MHIPWRTAFLIALLSLKPSLHGMANPSYLGPEVRTEQGVVAGKKVDSVFAFLGIPYAAPPVGDLRFRPPQPHAPWPAPRPASEYGNICPQLSADGVAGSEDCLFLNVFTP